MSEITQPMIWSVIIAMAAVNFSIRFTPLAALANRALPRPVLRWLSFIPVSVMGSLVASEVLMPKGVTRISFMSPGVWAALLTMLVFRFTRSFLGATVTGMASFVLLSHLLGIR